MTTNCSGSVISFGGGAIGLLISRFKWIIAALGIIGALAWLNHFPDGMIFAGGDVVQYFNRDWVERNLHYIWSNAVGEGGFSPIFLYYPFYAALFAVSDVFGLTPSQQSILYMLFFWGGAYAGCLVGFSLVTNKKFSIWSLEANLLALIYAINPYTFYAFYFIWGYSPFLFLYVVFPVLAVATIEYFGSPSWQQAKHSLAVLFVAHLFATIAYANLSFFIGVNLVLLGIGIGVAEWTIASKCSTKQFFLKILLLLGVEIAATGWAVLPQFPNLLFEGNPLNKGAAFDFPGWILWQRLSFWEFFTLNPAASGYMGSNSIAVALSLVVIGLVVWVWIVRSDKLDLSTRRRSLTILTIVLMVALLETKGKGIVPGASAVWAFSNPILGALRSNGKVFIFLPFLVHLMLLFSMSSWSQRARHLILGATLFACFVSSYPMLLGELQTKYSVGLRNGELCGDAAYCYLNRIPHEYSESVAVIKNDGLGGKILSLPYSVINSPGWSNYPAWKHVGLDPTMQLFSLPVVNMNIYHAFGQPYGREWAEGGMEGSEWLFNLVADLGVSYFLFHKDVRADFRYPAEYYLKNYEQKGLLRTIYDSQVVTVYRVADTYRQPVITAHFNAHPEQSMARVDVVKVNPTKYVITLPVNEHGINLRLREAFSQQWRVYILPSRRAAPAQQVAENLSWWESFFLPALAEDAHVRFGGYGNAWEVGTKALCPDFGCFADGAASQSVSLVIEYWPQRFVYLFLIIAVLIGISGAIMIFGKSIKQSLRLEASRAKT